MDKLFLGLAAAGITIAALFFSRSAKASEFIAPQNPTAGVINVPESTSPLGLKNNNPFNLEYHSIGWRGETGSDGRFSIFDDPINGIRAGMINVHTKMTRDGANTVRKILTILSPAFENPLEAYINFVAQKLNVAPDQVITFKDQIIPLSKAIIRFENGQQPFSDGELELALKNTGRV